MESHSKHRLGGKHSDPLVMRLPHTTQHGKHLASHLRDVPPSPSHPPTGPVPLVPLPAKPADNPANITLLAPAPAVKSIPVITGRGILTATPVGIFRHKGKVIAVALTASALALSVGNISPLFEQAGQAEATPPQTEQVPIITASVDAVIEHPSVDVTTVAAPPPPPPPPVVVEKPAVAQPPVAPPRVIVPAPAPPITRAIAPPPAPAPNLSRAQRIVSAALGQVGEWQDCVRLVADSLAAVGIYHYKWPVEYYQIGSAVSAANAQPGDLVYYVYGSTPGSLAHIAVYIGNGQAVHGGWNGNQTIIYSVNVGSGPNFIRLY